MASADEEFMRQALAEAARGAGRTHPNPAVGALLVRRGRVLASGWHRGAGQPHAEVEALAAAGNSARGATLYVTLEPCSTQGRTPPCTQAILTAGITRVVYGAMDPNPRHRGRAENLLRAEGVAVCSGVLCRECEALNIAWNKWMATGMPYVIAKAALTLDGRIASPPGRRWITGAAARQDAMKLRASVQAILVGGETVRIDNPRLTVRGVPAATQPRRVVWTKSGILPRKARIFTDEHRGDTLVFSNVSLRVALRSLGRQGIASVLIEGGGRTLGSAFDADLVDEVRFYLAPLIAGGSVPAVGGRGAGTPGMAPRLDSVTFRRIGQDVVLSGRVLREPV